ncbi:alpha/beta fold hydrolase [Curvibacter sp. APW13]|uniref:esterase/lipase family protein n=1 Tax=Curvibacter sp. APW13 TaxID=3077236 RepID=UPI0028DF7726|nr:alpha/beta fold hydrolase [Curvibacter sp. APW13]MDT8991692.1 alpha/beta fold hydrolase [Curvibacter sp. APW13]
MGAALSGALVVRCDTPVPTAIALAVLFPFLTTALAITYTMVLSRPGESALPWWQALAGEIWASIVVFVLRQPWTRGQPPLLPATAGSPQAVPVVLVHGYLCNHRLWDKVAAQLRAQGHAVQAVNLEPAFTSIDHYAPLVEQAVQALRSHTGQAQVALVGHSMGGLALRAWARRYGLAHAAQLISLGTPHAGTQVPQHLPSPNGRQMMWNSDWLQTLRSGEDEALRNRFSVAITAQDNIVFPQRAQVLDGVAVTVFEGIGHLQMCLHQPVIDWLLARLRQAPAEAHA